MLCDPAAAYRGRPRHRICLADTGKCTKKTPDPCKAAINNGYASRRGPEQRPHPTPPGQTGDSASCSAPAGTSRMTRRVRPERPDQLVPGSRMT